MDCKHLNLMWRCLDVSPFMVRRAQTTPNQSKKEMQWISVFLGHLVWRAANQMTDRLTKSWKALGLFSVLVFHMTVAKFLQSEFILENITSHLESSAGNDLQGESRSWLISWQYPNHLHAKKVGFLLTQESPKLSLLTGIVIVRRSALSLPQWSINSHSIHIYTKLTAFKAVHKQDCTLYTRTAGGDDTKSTCEVWTVSAPAMDNFLPSFSLDVKPFLLSNLTILSVALPVLSRSRRLFVSFSVMSFQYMIWMFCMKRPRVN